jgi:hypothetical protein
MSFTLQHSLSLFRFCAWHKVCNLPFYVGVILQNSVFQSPSTGQFKTPDPFRDNNCHKKCMVCKSDFLLKQRHLEPRRAKAG